LLLSGPGLLLAQMASARRSVQPTSSGQASSPWSTLPGRQPWHRSPVGVQHRVSTHPVSSSGVRRSSRPVASRPVSGHLGWSSGCPAVRSSAVHPSGVQPSGVHPSGVRPFGVHPSSVQPGGVPPRGFGRVRLLPCRAVALGPGQCGGHPSPQERVESRWAAALWSGSVDGRAGLDAGGAAKVACWSVGVGGGLGPGMVRAAALWAGAGYSARWPHLPRGCQPGWMRDHDAWLSWSLTPRWMVPGRGQCAGRRDGRAAPARPRLAASASGSLPTAL
jgi:hypothetical protein